MKKLTVLVIALFVLGMAAPVFAGPFSDVNPGHWAYEAIKKLSARGILEGYPNGQFKGNKALTRYEAAMMIARLIEGGHKGDYDTLQKLTIEFADELALLGVKVTALEDEVKMLRNELDAATLGGHGKMKISSEMRFRMGASKVDNAAASSISNNNLRYRMNVAAKIDDNVSAYLSFQDDILWGGAKQNNVFANGINASATGRNLFLGYVDIKNFGGLVDNFRIGRQTFTLGKGLVHDAEVDGILVRKDYRGTIFQLAGFEMDDVLVNGANDGMNTKIFTVDKAWKRVALGAYYAGFDQNENIAGAYDGSLVGLTLDGKLGKNVVAYLEYAKMTFKDVPGALTGAADPDNDAAAMKVGVEWTINKWYDLSVLYQKRGEDFMTLAHNDDYSDSAFYGNSAAAMGYQRGRTVTTATGAFVANAVDNYNNSKILSVIFGAKLRDDLQLDLWYEDLQQDETRPTTVAAGVAPYAVIDQKAMQMVATYQYRDNTAFKLRYRVYDLDENDLDWAVAAGQSRRDKITNVRLDMTVKF